MDCPMFVCSSVRSSRETWRSVVNDEYQWKDIMWYLWLPWHSMYVCMYVFDFQNLSLKIFRTSTLEIALLIFFFWFSSSYVSPDVVALNGPLSMLFLSILYKTCRSLVILYYLNYHSILWVIQYIGTDAAADSVIPRDNNHSIHSYYCFCCLVDPLDTWRWFFYFFILFYLFFLLLRFSICIVWMYGIAHMAGNCHSAWV